MNPLRKLLGDKRGNALLIAGAGLPMLIGAAGLASDTIQWSLWKRQLQRAADSAAIAGVYAKMHTQDVNAAVTYDLGKNNQVGYALLTTPVVSYPASGTDYNNAVAVELKMEHKLNFSSLFMSAPPTIVANASAGAVASGEYCAQAQINTNATGITAGGNTTVNLKCGMITNSTSMDAAVAFGSSSVTASPVAAVGGLDTTDNWASGTTLLPFTLAQPDPFADINAPTIPSPCNAKIQDNPKDVSTPAAGCYSAMTIKGNVTLSGTYIVTGDIDIQAQAEVTCASCTIILTNSTPANTGTVTINGGAKMNLTAPDSGTYKGILFYQDRGASTANINKINGNSSSFYKGAFYFPHQQVEYTGTAGLVFECVKLVTWQLTFMGNSKLNNNCPAGYYGDRFMGRHVRLVA